MVSIGMEQERRVGVLISLPRPVLEQLRAEAARAGCTLSREIERLAREDREHVAAGGDAQ